MLPTIDELLALDEITLRQHTEQAGDVFDVAQHRAILCKSVAISDVCPVRRGGELVAYAMLRPESNACWFVGAFGIHPAHRAFAVVSEMFTQVAGVVARRRIRALRSHVYKTNRLSMAFHRRLGFRVTLENDKAVEFYAGLDDLRNAYVMQRFSVLSSEERRTS